LCATCTAQLLGPARPAEVSPRPVLLPPVWTVAAYAGPVREAVTAFKDHGRWVLRQPLGKALATSIAAAAKDLGGPLLVVPVPGSPGSARARDGDHVGELARVAVRHLRATGADVRVVHGLVGVRRRRDQVGLDRAAREVNLATSMRATSSVVGAHSIVLVDDVVTTGASLAEAARALRAAGMAPSAAAVVAATPRRGARG
jgi:predicted amidophosphoribosyltransferase